MKRKKRTDMLARLYGETNDLLAEMERYTIAGLKSGGGVVERMPGKRQTKKIIEKRWRKEEEDEKISGKNRRQNEHCEVPILWCNKHIRCKIRAKRSLQSSRERVLQGVPRHYAGRQIHKSICLRKRGRGKRRGE